VKPKSETVLVSKKHVHCVSWIWSGPNLRSPFFAGVLSARKVSRQIDPEILRVYSNHELGGNHSAHNFYSRREAFHERKKLSAWLTSPGYLKICSKPAYANLPVKCPTPRIQPDMNFQYPTALGREFVWISSQSGPRPPLTGSQLPRISL
jgi:hypothetical protein